MTDKKTDKPIRVSMTLTREQAAQIDAARGSIPRATYCLDAGLRQAAKAGP